MNKKIYIVGWNGHQNAGDDAMTSVLVEYLVNKLNGQVEFNLASHSGMLAKYTTRTIKISSFSLYGAVSKIPLVRTLIALIRIEVIFRSKVDILIFGGGSIIQTKANSNIKEAIVKVTKKHNKDAICVAIGVSVGPFGTTSSEKAACRFLNRLDKISVRDRRSLEYIERSSIKVPTVMHPDIALALLTVRGRREVAESQNQKTDPFRIGICLRYGRSRKFYSSIQKLIDRIAIEQGSIIIEFFELSGHKREADGEEARSFLSWVTKENCHKNTVKFTKYNDDPLFYYLQLKRCSAVICVRLHAAVFAYSAGVPFAICSYHEKCKDFAELVGLQKELILTEDADDRAINLCANELWNEHADYLKDRESLIKEALRHFDFIQDIPKEWDRDR